QRPRPVQAGEDLLERVRPISHHALRAGGADRRAPVAGVTALAPALARAPRRSRPPTGHRGTSAPGPDGGVRADARAPASRRGAGRLRASRRARRRRRPTTRCAWPPAGARVRSGERLGGGRWRTSTWSPWRRPGTSTLIG